MLELNSSRFAIAPMMGYTDAHFLKLIDLLVPGVDLYQEMVVAQAFIRKDFNSKSDIGINSRLVLQLGGSEPALLARCCKKAYELGYDAVNLNVGCPSSRVVAGNIGAVLLKDIDLVIRCVQSMLDAAPIAVSVKTRLGIDQEPDILDDLTSGLLDVGCRELIMHARRAWLKGLDPKQNRDIPPLDYHRVVRLKADFPEMMIMLNGGINNLDIIKAYSGLLDGFMLGRLFISSPMLAAQMINKEIDFELVLAKYLDYVDAIGVNPRWPLRHLVNFFKGYPGAKLARKRFSEILVHGYNRKSVLDLLKL